MTARHSEFHRVWTVAEAKARLSEVLRCAPLRVWRHRVSGFLLDTNVVSELTKDAPNPRVVAFLTGQPHDEH